LAGKATFLFGVERGHVYIADAVRDLRNHFGDSQQAFAARMHLSIRSVANYERNRVPQAAILVAFAKAAYDAKRPDLASRFFLALFHQAGLDRHDWCQSTIESDTTGKTSSYLLVAMHQDEDDEASTAIHTFSEIILDYLFVADPEVKARAKKLLSMFNRAARRLAK
jgi:transcriptional regulator with XRE-family HTH domain